MLGLQFTLGDTRNFNAERTAVCGNLGKTADIRKQITGSSSSEGSDRSESVLSIFPPVVDGRNFTIKKIRPLSMIVIQRITIMGDINGLTTCDSNVGCLWVIVHGTQIASA